MKTAATDRSIEPTFTLRASDSLAPDLVDLYADRLSVKVGTEPGPLGITKQEQLQRLRALAREMRAWKKTNP